MIAGMLGFAAAIVVAVVGAAFVAWIRWAADWEVRVMHEMMSKLSASFATISIAMDAAMVSARRFDDSWRGCGIDT